MEFDGLTLIADAPAGDALPTSRIQVAKLGRFQHPVYGAFKVTPDHYADFKRNLADRGEIPIDLDHAPEKGGSSAAAGWIKGLEQDGDKLYAKVEWTELGQDNIAKRIYRYFSPTIKWKSTGDDGKPRGAEMIAGALTNRPFFARMAPVALSATFSDEFGDGAIEVSDSRGRMDRDKLITIFGLDAEATDEQIEEAATAFAARPEAPAEPAEGTVTLSTDQVAELTAQAAAGAAASDELKANKFETAFTKALTEGRTVPSVKEHLEGMYADHPDQVLAILESAPKVVSTERIGAGGDGPEAPEGDDPARFDLNLKIEALAADRKIPYMEAFSLVANGEVPV